MDGFELSSCTSAGTARVTRHRKAASQRRGSVESPAASRFSLEPVFFFFDDDDEDEESAVDHSLDRCFLCKKHLGGAGHCNIYMYRGNMGFCSEECRQEKMEMDEVMEKRYEVFTSRRKKNKDQFKSNNTTTTMS